MNDYDLIAPFYDSEHAQFDEDLDLYRNFAELCSGSLLELACGSGRLLLPLAHEGHTLTGVDTSERMLALAQARFDVGVDPRLATGLRVVAGEPRVRYLHTLPGATADVISAWRAILGPAALAGLIASESDVDVAAA